MIRSALSGLTLAMSLIAFAGGSAAHDAHQSAPGGGTGGAYAFVPEPGTYSLPPIKKAGGGSVLDERGVAHDLAGLLSGQITVLAFIYTRCGDACPTANLQMSVLQDLASRDRSLSGRMRLASMSFDPDYDTPEMMAELASQWRSADRRAPEWLFLTAPNRESLAPVLVSYNQAIGPKPDAQSTTGPLNHIFRAFLVDPGGRIRNIYSLDFFDPELVLGDIRTLLLDGAAMHVDREK
jgi:cytochrome oxidase Cu insertion factor (SCO1/SenC/PrrC family)